MSSSRSAASRWIVLVVALSLVAAACGSTVQPTPGAQPDERDGVAFEQGVDEDLELGVADPSATETPSDADRDVDDLAGFGSGESTTSGGGQSTGGGQGTTARGSGTQQGQQGTETTGGDTEGSGGGEQEPQTGAAATGRGFDEDQVRIGLGYAEDGGEANEAIGAAGITQGDPRRNYEALLEYFNARGGLAGREIVPVYHRYQATSAQGAGTQEQAACATYTEDNEVFATLDRGTNFTDGTLLSCLDNARTPVLGSPGASIFDDAVYERFRNFAETNTLSLDAIARLWPRALAQGDYFEPRGPASPVRVGLVTYDSERTQRVTERSLRPAMRAVGQEFHDEVYISAPDRLADVGGMSAEANNAILRFRSEGIEHVMIQDYGNALLTFAFMTAAENQGYRPRYGLNSNNGGQVIVGTAPPQQFSEAVLMGWNPLFDVPEREFDEPMGQARAECDRIYEEAGITFDNLNARAVGYLHCDQFMSLIAATEAMSGGLAQDALVPAFVGLGTAYESALIGPTRVAPDRRYGINRVRLAEFFDDCTCFRYTTGWSDVP